MKRPTLLLLLAALTLPTGLSACSDSAGSGQPPTEKVRYGAVGAKIRGLDPMDIGDVLSSGIASNFYEPLYQYHYLKRPYEVIPCLAADMPTISEDGLTVTIPIRQDVYFHDDPCFPNGKGRQLTAEDFVYSWKRIAYIKNVSKNWWVLEDRIVGLDEFREETKDIPKDEMDYSQPVEGLRAIDTFTLQLKLKQPWPAMLYALCHLPTAAVPHEAVEMYGDETFNHAVGTGPFLLENWTRGSRMTMVRNPNFREEFYPSEGEPGDEEAGLLDDAGKRLPLLDRAEFNVVLEDQPYWLMFDRGEIDSAGINKDAFDSAISANKQLRPSMAARGITLTKTPEPTTFWLGFNMEDPVVGENLPLRQAMNLAFDRATFIELFTNGRGEPAKGPLPPTADGYDPDLDSPYTTFDLEKAKEKAEEAKRLHREKYGKDLPPITILIPGTDATSVQYAQFYRRCFEAAGISVKTENVDWPTLQDKVKSKSAQCFAMGWIMDWPDPENMLLLWYGPNESPGANNMNYKSEAFDELYRQITVMLPSDERTRLLQEMEQIVVDDLPCVFTTHRVSYRLQHPWYKNYKPHVYGYGLMKYTDVDSEMRWKAVGR